MNLCQKLVSLMDPSLKHKIIVHVRCDDDSVITGSLHEVGDDYLLIFGPASGKNTPECHFVPRERIRLIKT